MLLGAVWAGSVVLGVDVWGVWGVDVSGVDVCGVVPDGLCVTDGAGPEGDVLSGVVLWATTQLADSSNRESDVALNFITISRLRYKIVHSSEFRRASAIRKSSGIPIP